MAAWIDPGIPSGERLTTERGEITLMDTMEIKHYKVSLRLRHPTIDPDEITSSLDLIPTIHWRVGERRKTHKGELLEGFYDHSYWVGRLPAHQNPMCLIDELEFYLRKLEMRSEFMRSFHETGGNAEFFVGRFGRGGITFTWDLLERCAFLRAELGLDVYEGD